MTKKFQLTSYLIEVLEMPEPHQPYYGTLAQGRGFQWRRGQWKRCTQTGLVRFEHIWLCPQPGGEVVRPVVQTGREVGCG